MPLQYQVGSRIARWYTSALMLLAPLKNVVSVEGTKTFDGSWWLHYMEIHPGTTLRRGISCCKSTWQWTGAFFCCQKKHKQKLYIYISIQGCHWQIVLPDDIMSINRQEIQQRMREENICYLVPGTLQRLWMSTSNASAARPTMRSWGQSLGKCGDVMWGQRLRF